MNFAATAAGPTEKDVEGEVGLEFWHEAQVANGCPAGTLAGEKPSGQGGFEECAAVHVEGV